MPDIILLWNTDPSESAVTLPLGRLLKADLEKRGYEVRLLKVPFNRSIYAEFAQEEREGRRPYGEILAHKVAKNIRELSKHLHTKTNATVIDLHTTPEQILLQPHGTQRSEKLTKTKNWRVTYLDTMEQGQIELVGLEQGIYYIEVPAAYKNSAGVGRRQWDRFPQFGVGSQVSEYFTQQTDGRSSKQKNYLAPLVIRKIGHLVDETIKRDHGLTRKPKGYRHKSRIPYPKPRRVRRGK